MPQDDLAAIVLYDYGPAEPVAPACMGNHAPHGSVDIFGSVVAAVVNACVAEAAGSSITVSAG